MGEITGRKVLIFTVAAFGLIIAVNVTMAVLATRTFPGLEVENSFVASQEFNTSMQAQKALGWIAGADFTDGRLVVDIRDGNGKPAQVERIEALVGWATSRQDDFRPEFTRIGGRFEAPAELVPGNWDVYLKAWAPDGTLFQQRLALHVGDVVPPPAPDR